MLTLSKVGAPDLPELMPMLRGYCDFYQVNPSEGALLAMCQALIDEPAQGEQWIARDQAGTPAGFATVFWTWQTLYAARVGVLNDLYVVAAGRGLGTGRALIERCRQRCGEQGAIKLVWETAIDNTTAQRLYDGIGAEQSSWYTYEIDPL
jgi:GNAT superfamily N-acetyltransferase